MLTSYETFSNTGEQWRWNFSCGLHNFSELWKLKIENLKIHLLEFIPLGNCFRSYLRQLFIPLFWYQNFVNRKLELFNFAIRGTRWRTARTILETERPVALGFWRIFFFFYKERKTGVPGRKPTRRRERIEEPPTNSTRLWLSVRTHPLRVLDEEFLASMTEKPMLKHSLLQNNGCLQFSSLWKISR